MSFNPAIKEKVIKYSKGDKDVEGFLLEVIEHEAENGQYGKQYRKLIEKAVDKGE